MYFLAHNVNDVPEIIFAESFEAATKEKDFASRAFETRDEAEKALLGMQRWG